ncbi:ABC transporter family substrate-binding protein [Streptomyces yaanensis]|uniref:ABC transporter family substrate-binding protein n=1 Tax=Streptomyces yaanensis TaxID=1142239 RepID=A0ABV7SKN8_9ACTN|nr:ABC transporter family substrate-binding protein [Streptomyces sp. CGMCC 4.7035]WNB97568.1 ABC transporter family substrate-binding protein [Streptomyces sp. CGMCC 4.7035]
MSHDGVGPRAVLRSVAFLTAGALAVPVLAACSSDEKPNKPVAVQDIAPAARGLVADGGTLHWAIDAVPGTLNTFQADADTATARIAGAVLPSMFRLDANGRPQRNPDFLTSAKVVSTEPKQVVVYRLAQQAVWSDGREIGADDFAAQWRALSGRNSAYWTARNAGYDRIEKVERGANNLEVKVTFAKPYADWRSLFSPLYPKDVMGTPAGFNDGARRNLKVTAGPFSLQKVDHEAGHVTLTRNPRWWGRPAKLSELVLVAVPRDKRAAALADGKIDLAEIDPEEAERITLAARDKGATPLQGPSAEAEGAARAGSPAGEQQALRGFVIRKSLEPSYTQLALNGSRGPLADDRVRRAVARALDRTALAGLVLKPLGLPAVPVGSHLALSGQPAYADNSGALGGQDTARAKALLTEAGWVPGGPLKEEKKEKKEAKKPAGAAGSEGRKTDQEHGSGDDGTYTGGQDGQDSQDIQDNKGHEYKDPQDQANKHHPHHPQHPRHADEQAGRPVGGAPAQEHGQQGPPPGAYAPKGTAAPAGGAAAVLAKDGKPLKLQFVLPSGPGSQSLRTVGDRIARMLDKVGIRTEISKVSDESYFRDHIASGDYDLALYSWPASAFPATDARPIYAKPVPAADGSLTVEQNYTRVGTDQVDQLFDQAIATLDEGEERDLMRKADARIWAAAGSIPLYQRPQLTATRLDLANAGAFGFQTPVYEDMGFLKKGAHPSPQPSS